MSEKSGWNGLYDEIYLAQIDYFHNPSQAGGWPGHSTSRTECHACRTAAKVAADAAGNLLGVFPEVSR